VTRVSAESYWVSKTLGGRFGGFIFMNEKETETEIRCESFGLEGQRFILETAVAVSLGQRSSSYCSR